MGDGLFGRRLLLLLQGRADRSWLMEPLSLIYSSQVFLELFPL